MKDFSVKPLNYENFLNGYFSVNDIHNANYLKYVVNFPSATLSITRVGN